jgi:hypothetical protein
LKQLAGDIVVAVHLGAGEKVVIVLSTEKTSGSDQRTKSNYKTKG